MPSVEQDNHRLIHKDIIPRVETLEKGQEDLKQSYISMKNQMDTVTNQMKAMELSNNDIKQTVVGYGQTHSMLLTKAMESLVQANNSNTAIIQEVQSTKERVVGETKQIKEKIEGEKAIAKLGFKEKIFVTIISSPGLVIGVKYIVQFIKNLF